MKVHVDLALCVGHGRCYALCPELFGEDDEGHCRLRAEQVPTGLEDKARRAAENCPELAIRIEEG